MDLREDFKNYSEDDFSDLFLAIRDEESKTAVLNQNRFRAFRFAYGVVEKILLSSGMRLSYKLHEPFKSMGSISIEGKTLSFAQTEWFSRAAEFADVTDICPLANGDVRLTFTFHNMTTAIE